MPLDSSEIPDEQIEAGAKALRRRMIPGGDQWEGLPDYVQTDWRHKAYAVLHAAALVREQARALQRREAEGT